MDGVLQLDPVERFLHVFNAIPGRLLLLAVLQHIPKDKKANPLSMMCSSGVQLKSFVRALLETVTQSFEIFLLTLVVVEPLGFLQQTTMVLPLIRNS